MLIDVISYSICAFAFFVLFAVLISDKHRGHTKNILLLAAITSTAWAASIVISTLLNSTQSISYALEIAKNIAWIWLLLNMLSGAFVDGVSLSRKWGGTLKAFFTVAIIVITAIYVYTALEHESASGSGIILSLLLMLSVLGIVLVEQLYRNMPVQQRWAIKFLCFGLLGSYVYNFYMYSDALLYQRIDPVLWKTRGFVESVLLPLIAISISRDPLWSPEIFISRRVVFHTTTLIASALYLLVMGAAGYYVKEFGGSWGPVIQAFFLFVTILALVLFLASRRIRSQLKVLLNKHFYPYKYDYRDEWLRFINTISFGDDPLYRKTIISIAQIIESPGGMLWLRKDNGFYECVDAWEMPRLKVREPSEASMPKFLEKNEFVISVDEYRERPEVYNRLDKLDLPVWVNELSPWLIVPLINIDNLIGFIVLSHAKAHKKHFNWEDSDLLKTAARQAASYIAQQEASIALIEAKQFESFNKLSTYIVHDIKNLVAQLSLIISNAEKHKNNPLFMNDVINTIDNTVQKMNKMLDMVSGKTTGKAQSSRIDVIQLLQELIRLREKSGTRPIPSLGCESHSSFVRADRNQLLAIFGHLVQNAQDATPDDGRIQILQSVENGMLLLKFIDTGQGMTEEFIKNQLFRPFKTTKGKGMGIGVYETREIISALGGTIDVDSSPDKGTCFSIRLPLCDSVSPG
jgi:putative PEP-CTERM system histidine kinase